MWWGIWEVGRRGRGGRRRAGGVGLGFGYLGGMAFDGSSDFGRAEVDTIPVILLPYGH